VFIALIAYIFEATFSLSSKVLRNTRWILKYFCGWETVCIIHQPQAHHVITSMLWNRKVKERGWFLQEIATRIKYKIHSLPLYNILTFSYIMHAITHVQFIPNDVIVPKFFIATTSLNNPKICSLCRYKNIRFNYLGFT